MAFSPDGKTLHTLDDNRTAVGIDVSVWGKDTGGTPGAAFGWFSPDGRQYLCTDWTRNLTVYETATHTPLNPPPALLRAERSYRHEGAGGVAFSADGRKVQHKFVGYVWVEWETDSGKEVTRVASYPSPGELAAHSDQPTTASHRAAVVPASA